MVKQLFHITLLMAVVVAVAQGMKCFSKADKKQQNSISERFACKTPKDTAVHMPIPDGYDEVTPHLATVKKCHHNVCERRAQKCVAVRTSNKTVKVTAKRRNINRYVTHCVQVTLEEDTECGCGCNNGGRSCKANQVFSDLRCRCECLDSLEQECKHRMTRKPRMYMWDKNICSCPCNNAQECGTGTVWSYDECRCVSVDDEKNSISEEFWFP